MKSLQDPVSVLKGVGPKRVADLATLNIDTIEDLLTFYPFRRIRGTVEQPMKR